MGWVMATPGWGEQPRSTWLGQRVPGGLALQEPPWFSALCWCRLWQPWNWIPALWDPLPSWGHGHRQSHGPRSEMPSFPCLPSLWVKELRKRRDAGAAQPVAVRMRSLAPSKSP